MSTAFIGIDPGLSGAVALIYGDYVEVRTTPTLKVGARAEYNLPEMRAALTQTQDGGNCPQRVVAALEKTHAMPRQGTVSMFRMGYGLGLWEGLLAALGIPYTLVAPQTWKAVMLRDMARGERDKNASRLRAYQLFPALATEFKTKSSHGKAEALLLASYIQRIQGGA